MNSLNETYQIGRGTMTSPLMGAMKIDSLMMGRKSGKKKDFAVPTLTLTSLIDAFAIIVIYLLIGTTSSNYEVPLSKKITLPTAGQGIGAEETPIVRIEDGKYYLDSQSVSIKELGKKLFDLKEKLKEKMSNKPEDFSIQVQADQKLSFEQVNPLILAASEAGIQKLKFAVMPNQTESQQSNNK